MSFLSTIARRLRMLVRGDRLERGLEDEMRLHMEIRRERLEAGGLSPEEARAMARRRFGNPLLVHEVSVDV